MNNKLYGKLSGRCSTHGARRKPEKSWRWNTICEVTAECEHVRTTKYGKRYMRRQARRRGWELP